MDCVFTWGPWSTCSAKCGGGSQERVQKRTQLAAYGGKACGALQQTRKCNEQGCHVDCVMGKWSSWSQCTRSCGVGTHLRTRAIKVERQNGGRMCGAAEQKKDCSMQACPVDCVLTQWGMWSSCTKTCGRAGIRVRTRKIYVQPSRGGKLCENKFLEQKGCNRNPCPIDCKVSNWGKWGKCTQACGGGKKTRTRTILTHARHNGWVCPPTTMDDECNTQTCPKDCKLSAWGKWSSCTVTCGGRPHIDAYGKYTGGGVQSRSRKILSGAVAGGNACGMTTETKGFCNTHECPVDCIVSNWSKWSACTATCGDSATKTRTRQRVRDPAFHGKPCASPLVETVVCTKLQDCPIDCELTQWTTWTSCTKRCAGGSQERTRQVITPPNKYGAACAPRYATQPCNTQPCPINCVAAKWGRWSKCSHSCGGGAQVRVRPVKVQPQHGGKSCGVVKEKRACGVKTCPVDCAMSKWTSWTTCTKTCGTGHQKRARSTRVTAYAGGKKCPHSSEARSCNTEKCAIDCVHQGWSSWTSCSTSCNGGIRSRKKTITTKPQFGGKGCGVTSQKQTCSTQKCPVDCTEAGYGKWSACTRSCGGGYTERNMRGRVEAKHGGRACSTHLKQTKVCNKHACPIDCNLGLWTSWSECTKTCAGGSQTRTRPVLIAPKYGGQACAQT